MYLGFPVKSESFFRRIELIVLGCSSTEISISSSVERHFMYAKLRRQVGRDLENGGGN